MRFRISPAVSGNPCALTPDGFVLLSPTPFCAIACYVLFYSAAWKLFIRKIDLMLLPMIAVVVFGIIDYDLISKYVVTEALPTDAVIYLHLVHILVCVCVIAAVVQIAAVYQLESEKTIAKHLLAEREHQYEMGRDGLQDHRCNQHQVPRSPSSDPPFGR